MVRIPRLSTDLLSLLPVLIQNFGIALGSPTPAKYSSLPFPRKMPISELDVDQVRDVHDFDTSCSLRLEPINRNHPSIVVWQDTTSGFWFLGSSPVSVCGLLLWSSHLDFSRLLLSILYLDPLFLYFRCTISVTYRHSIEPTASSQTD